MLEPRNNPRSSNEPGGRDGARKEPLRNQSQGIIRHVRKFGWDLLGTFLFLLGILTAFGLLGLSRGSIINSWITFIKQTLGWTSYLVFFILGLLGWLSIRHSAGKPFPLSFGRLLGFEGAILSLSPLLATLGGVSLDRALQGFDGGTLGWGLAQLLASTLPNSVVLIFYFFLFLIFISIGTGLFKALNRRIIDWSTTPGDKPQSQSAKTVISTGRAAVIRQTQRSNDHENLVPLAQWRDDRLPPLNLLIGEHSAPPDQERIKQRARLIETKLLEFGIPAKVIGFRVGPTVTQYALEPGYFEKQGPDGVPIQQKVKVSQISSLSRDLALALSATRIRIETPVPGRSYVGIEVPNSENAFVRLRSILESEQFLRRKSMLTIALGRNVSGDPVFTDLEKLPHLLIAGTTNSGKSVCMTAMITCLIMNNTPTDLKLVLMDPKLVELVRFNGIPHLLGKVETQIERMLAVLHWAVAEMDSRYRILSETKAKNLEIYNQKMLQKKKPTLPRIIIVIDELSDLMTRAMEQTEFCLMRLAQMARATGIHLVVATQRPSVDVVTGNIKANFPARISFSVSSSIDSRVILDVNGAESLLGKGDMLFLDPQDAGMQRIQGILVSDTEIEKVVRHWQKISPASQPSASPWDGMVVNHSTEDSDNLIQQATQVVRDAGKASASLLQRRLRVGYPRAARLLDELEEMGVVGPSQGSGRDREVLEGSEFIDETDDNQEIEPL